MLHNLIHFAPDGGDGGNGGGGGSDGGDGGSAATISAEDFSKLQSQVDNVNKALEEERGKRKAAEAAAKKAEEEKGKGAATVESLSQQLSTLQAQLATESKKGTILPLLTEAHNPADAFAFLSLDEIDGEDDAKAAVAKLKESKPYLFKQEGDGTGQGRRGMPGPGSGAGGDSDVELESDPKTALQKVFGRAKRGTDAYARMTVN